MCTRAVLSRVCVYIRWVSLRVLWRGILSTQAVTRRTRKPVVSFLLVLVLASCSWWWCFGALVGLLMEGHAGVHWLGGDGSADGMHSACGWVGGWGGCGSPCWPVRIWQRGSGGREREKERRKRLIGHARCAAGKRVVVVVVVVAFSDMRWSVACYCCYCYCYPAREMDGWVDGAEQRV